MKNLLKKDSTKQAKAAPIPDVPAKKQADMNEILSVLRPAVQADPDRFLRRESAYNVYCYWAQAGSTIEDHLEPVFWLTLANKFSPNDELIVKEETGQWRGHFLIKSAGPDGVDIVLLNENQIGGTAPLGAKTPLKEGPHIEYRGQHLLWSVFDGEKELISRLPTEADAITWLANDNVTGRRA